jgi:hypothetical protein
MGQTIARTARIPHECDSCWWTLSLRGVPTILPGHRYLLHTAFPGEEGYEEGTRPARLTECAEHAISRTDGIASGEFEICGTYCCGTTPCALPHEKGAPGHDHQCRDCVQAVA